MDYNTIAKLEQLKRIDREGERLFGQVSFEERYLSLFHATTYARYFLPSLSIITATYLLCSRLDLSVVASIIIGLALFAGYEWLKLSGLKLGFASFYSPSIIGYSILAFSIALSVGSAYLSIEGAREYYLQSDTRASKIASHYAVLTDSINQRITAIEQYKKDRWAGLLTKSERATVKGLYDEINLLKADQREKEKAVLAESDFNAFQVGGAVLVLEGLILLCNWFYVFYMYARRKEQQYVTLIGSTPPTGGKKGRVLSIDTLDKEQKIREAIESGITDMRELTSMFRLNVKQASGYIKKYKVA